LTGQLSLGNVPATNGVNLKMIFTKIAKVTAWIALIGSALHLMIGFGIATELFGPYEEALQRYGGKARNSG
jgi:hypothetical protein